MRFLVLGSAAGGGFPQWNCRCPNCRLAWAGDSTVEPRSQTSLAISADSARWVIVGASPDLRQQVLGAPALHPREGLRHSPIAGVFLPNADIDNIAGLLTLRERQALAIWGSAATLAEVRSGMFAALEPQLVRRIAVEPDQPFETGTGFSLRPFALPGKIPLYREPDDESRLGETDSTLGLEIAAADRRAYYIPNCARVTETLRARLDGADLLFFDGTTYEDDEMIRLGLSPKTAQRMGHLAMNGPQGSIAALAGLKIRRKIFTHINNSNPVLRRDSAERARVEAAGWEIARDGLAFAWPA